MKYDDLNGANVLGEVTLRDGYSGRTALASLHFVGGELWIKTRRGCFRAPSAGLDLRAGQAQECAEALAGRESWN